MRSDRSGQRLACPHCRANNFVGQVQCWQCHGSLPPPEEVWNGRTGAGPQARVANAPVFPVAHPPKVQYPAPAPQQTPYVPHRSAASRVPLILCIALLTAGVAVWLGTRSLQRSVAPAASFPGETAEMRSLRADARGVVPESELPNSGLPDPGGTRLAMPERDAVPAGTDPTEMAAKRAIEHAIPRLGLPPGSGSDGKVHLRNGDSISTEQYEDVQRKLQHNPILGEHPPVPRL